MLGDGCWMLGVDDVWGLNVECWVLGDGCWMLGDEC